MQVRDSLRDNFLQRQSRPEDGEHFANDQN